VLSLEDATKRLRGLWALQLAVYWNIAVRECDRGRRSMEFVTQVSLSRTISGFDVRSWIGARCQKIIDVVR